MKHTIIRVMGEPKIVRHINFVDQIWENCFLDNSSTLTNVRVTVRYSHSGVDAMNKPMLPFTVYLNGGYPLYPLVVRRGDELMGTELGLFYRTMCGDLQ